LLLVAVPLGPVHVTVYLYTPVAAVLSRS
jgi:hypothetical protein